MNWFLVFFLVMGFVVGIIPKFIAKNIKRAVETGFQERDRAFDRVNTWLLVYSWAIALVAFVFTVEVGLSIEKDVKKLNSRIETIEEQIVIPAADTLEIKNLVDFDE